jgi:hypothetical protein
MPDVQIKFLLNKDLTARLRAVARRKEGEISHGYLSRFLRATVMDAIERDERAAEMSERLKKGETR